jgi:hypothetical protein
MKDILVLKKLAQVKMCKLCMENVVNYMKEVEKVELSLGSPARLILMVVERWDSRLFYFHRTSRSSPAVYYIHTGNREYRKNT